MDFQGFVDCVNMSCAVLSVEKTPLGQCGTIRIVCANQKYKETMGPAYYDGMIYHELVPKDLKFEDFCFRAAFLNQHMHAYVETSGLNCWTDQQMIPMAGGDDHLGYCQFIFEFTKTAEADRLTDVSLDTAATVIQCCINLSKAEDFKESLRSILLDILHISGAVNGRIMLMDHEKEEAVNFCEMFNAKQLASVPQETAAIPYEIVKTWEDMIGVSNCVIVTNDREMDELERRNPVWAKSMREYDITSLVMIPLRRGNLVFGYLYVVNFDISKVVSVKELLELLSYILGSEIFNYQLLKKLELISTVDWLTGLKNRRALVQHMEELVNDPTTYTLGIINMDLNGLKEVNDRDGHDAGDDLLRHCANTMKRVFPEDHLYRVGGDEFIALVLGESQESIDQKVEQLRALGKEDPQFNIAIGSFWAKERLADINTALLDADKDMYSNKKEYYRLHPEKSRRRFES